MAHLFPFPRCGHIRAGVDTSRQRSIAVRLNKTAPKVTPPVYGDM